MCTIDNKNEQHCLLDVFIAFFCFLDLTDAPLNMPRPLFDQSRVQMTQSVHMIQVLDEASVIFGEMEKSTVKNSCDGKEMRKILIVALFVHKTPVCDNLACFVCAVHRNKQPKYSSHLCFLRHRLECSDANGIFTFCSHSKGSPTCLYRWRNASGSINRILGHDGLVPFTMFHEMSKFQLKISTTMRYTRNSAKNQTN